jgi:hypothetical protein
MSLHPGEGGGDDREKALSSILSFNTLWFDFSEASDEEEEERASVKIIIRKKVGFIKNILCMVGALLKGPSVHYLNGLYCT